MARLGLKSAETACELQLKAGSFVQGFGNTAPSGSHTRNDDHVWAGQLLSEFDCEELSTHGLNKGGLGATYKLSITVWLPLREIQYYSRLSPIQGSRSSS